MVDLQLNNFWPILGNVLAVFLIIALGALVRKIEWITRDADKSLAKLTTNVLLPAYFVQKILFSGQVEMPLAVWTPPFFGLMTTGTCLFLAFAIARIAGPWFGLRTGNSQRVFALCVGICNYGFIPLPLAEHFYPESLVDLILHNVGVNLALWSVGVALISGSFQDGWKKALGTPPFLSVLAAILFRLYGPQYTPPLAIESAITSLGHCAIPLGLLLSGAISVDFLSETNWKGSWRIMLAAVLLRQLIFPILMLAAALSLCESESMLKVMLLQAAMPAAIFPIVLVKLYDQDLDTALRVIIASSLSGVVTIPAWLILGAWWLQV
jgi:predicted permease